MGYTILLRKSPEEQCRRSADLAEWKTAPKWVTTRAATASTELELELLATTLSEHKLLTITKW